MKILLSVVTCFILSTSYCLPIVESYTINEKYFSTYFDYNNSVTMFLEKDKHSCCHEYAYSVKGWYKFKNIKKRVELVGIYFLDELYLYNLDSVEEIEFLENYDGSSGETNFWDDMDYYKSLRNFNEKIVIKKYDVGQLCVWQKGSYRQVIDLHFNRDLSVSQTYNYLRLNKNKSIHLDNVVNYIAPDFNIITYSKNKKKIVLGFNAMPRVYVMGICGAGDYNGLIQLDFDENKSLIKVKEVILSSCDEDLFATNKIIKNNKITYDVFYQADKLQYKVEVDLGDAIIRQVEK